jgi:cysteine desulfurase/selenocysteine lyase
VEPIATTTHDKGATNPAARSRAAGIDEIRAQFPILERRVNGHPIAYLDNGATSQKPLAVIEALDRFWRSENSNVHRGVYTLSEEATALYERARQTVARHIGAEPREVIFTRNATEAINLVANSWGRANLGPGDRVLVTELEHHSNIVPWYMIARERGAELDWAPITDDGALDLDAFRALLERGPKLVAVAHVSNVLGTVNPIAEIARMAHDAGVPVVVDGAQAVPKMALDVRELDADFYAFTGHKAYGPTGIGVLYGRRELLEDMGPFIGGGSMIRSVRKDEITWAGLPARFEAGTPPIGEAIGLAAAIEWLDGVGLETVHARDAELAGYALERLADVPGLRVFGLPAGANRAGIVSFELDGMHPHDVSEILDRHGVCVRAGHHCAQVLMERLEVAATTRASFGAYTTEEEIDRLVEALHDARRVFQLE